MAMPGGGKAVWSAFKCSRQGTKKASSGSVFDRWIPTAGKGLRLEPIGVGNPDRIAGACPPLAELP